LKVEKKAREFETGNKSYKFRIGEKFQNKAMWALINLYQDKIGTPVKEVISNARDANRENGKADHDIKITLTKKVFRVQDQGKGMSPELVEEVVTNFGASTKSHDNLSTGGFGIGFKSPLCRVNQFQVETIWNGKKYFYIVAKNGEDLELNLISETKCNEPTGTTVEIPMIEASSFGRNDELKRYGEAIAKTTKFWEVRPEIEFQGMDFELKDLPSMIKLDENIYRISKGVNSHRRHYWYKDNVTIVIDGLPYEYKGEHNLSVGSNIVLYFNTGDIQIHETRERIEPTKAQEKIILEKLKVVTNYDNKILKNKLTFEQYKKHAEFYSAVTFKNEHVSITNRGVYIDHRMYHWHKPYRYGSTPSAKADNKNANIPLGSTVYFNDIGEGVTKYAQRAKGLVTKTHENVYVLETKNDFLEKVFTFKNISELPMPERKKTVLPTDKIRVLQADQYGNAFYRTIKPNQTDFVYVNYKDETSRADYYFCRQDDRVLVKVPKKYLSTIEGLDNWVTLEEYKNSVKLTEKDKQTIKLRAMSKGNRSLYRLAESFTDTNLLEYVKMFKESNNSFDRHHTINAHSDLVYEYEKEITKQVREWNEKFTQLQKTIEKRFPLVYDSINKGDQVATTYIKAMINFEKETN
jgi:hypothetical protein